MTLVELLVVVAVVATLIALLLPAIQSARETARRVRCGNNLKQIGLAIHAYHAQRTALPNCRIADRWAPWAVMILPYLEAQAIYDLWDLELSYYYQLEAARTTPTATYVCPTRRSPMMSVKDDTGPYSEDGRPGGPHVPGATGDYAACTGYATEDSGLWYGGGRGAIVNPLDSQVPILGGSPRRRGAGQSLTSITHIRDGTSNTMLVGEKHVPQHRFGQALAGDGSIYNSDHDYQIYRAAGPGRGLARDARQEHTINFGGQHPGICMIGLCDGSVRAVDVTVSEDLLRLLADRADGQVTPSAW